MSNNNTKSLFIRVTCMLLELCFHQQLDDKNTVVMPIAMSIFIGAAMHSLEQSALAMNCQQAKPCSNCLGNACSNCLGRMPAGRWGLRVTSLEVMALAWT